MPDSLSRLKSNLRTAYSKAGFSDKAARRRVIMKFAQQYAMVYFDGEHSATAHFQMVRGTTSSLGQQDENICIGSHSDYDIMFLERTGTIVQDGFPQTQHHWHIMAFDLHTHSNLPFLFVGTKQQSNTFYARLFSTRREARQLDTSFLGADPSFAQQYTLVSSPAEQVILAQIFTQPVTASMAKYQHPFAIEIQDDTLYVITEPSQVSESSLTKMLHYGLWLAKHLDENVPS